MNTYDEIPYPVYSHATTHPAVMATLAALIGLKPPDIAHARVLELGCASGGNIIPMALGLPQATFVGVDNSARQMKSAEAYRSALRLGNLTLHNMDLLDVDDSLGQFDYIIAHGLYSWVGKKEQEKIFEICKRNLAPDGVAYISYNTQPGWRALGIIREMLLYHTRGTADPQTKLARARSLINFFTSALPAQNTPVANLNQAFAEFFRVEVATFAGAHDRYLLHDLLEDVNDPIYFSDFVKLANSHGLQYLADVGFRETHNANQDSALAQGVMNMAEDIVAWEQYMDFIKGRTFRQTLLIHADRRIGRTLKPEVIESLYISSGAQPSQVPGDRPEAVQEFGNPETMAVSTDHAVTKAAMTYLAEIYPRYASFDEAYQAACQRLGRTAEDDYSGRLDARILCNSLLTAFTYSSQLVDLSVHAPHMVTTVSERPMAAPWARLQVLEEYAVTNLRHDRVELNPLLAYIVRYLDGTRTLDEVADTLVAGPVAGGKLEIRDEQEQPIPDMNRVRDLLRGQLPESLAQLARLAILVG